VRIAIVGGGLGGLAAALFLRQAGAEVTVYEQCCRMAQLTRPAAASCGLWIERKSGHIALELRAARNHE